MASDKNSSGAPLYQRSPSQAHRIFGFDVDRTAGGKYALGMPRPRFLFLVRFVRAPSSNAPASWENGLQFAVKRFDRPAVTADTQVLNQYNKKRIIQTGIKYGPVKIDFHDTSDQMVMQMWHEYASYYFGDFRKVTDADWAYDQTNPDFKNTGGTGFGLTLPNELSTEQTKNSPVGFFSKLECYQFAAGSYTQFDLINPKIVAFNPDDMDYSNDQSHGLAMTLEYETIIYQNDNKPKSLKDATASDFMKSLLTNRNFVGDVFEPIDDHTISQSTSNTPAVTKTLPDLFSSFGLLKGTINQNVGTLSSVTNIKNTLLQGAPLISGLPSNSALSSFGNFSFGSLNTQSLLNGVTSSNSTSALNKLIGQASANTNTSKGVSASNYDAAKGEIQWGNVSSTAPGSVVTSGSAASTAYSDAALQNSVVGTIDVPVDTGNDDYSDWV